jgi:hypothetical protein
MLKHCIVFNNTSTNHGGGAFLDSRSALRATGGKFVRNYAHYGGGALYLYRDSNATLASLQFEKNAASIDLGSSSCAGASQISLPFGSLSFSPPARRELTPPLLFLSFFLPPRACSAAPRRR